jgi:hypothetical protein
MFRTTLMGVILSAMTVGPAMASSHTEHFQADFSGFNEVGALNAQSGAILSAGRASLELRLDRVNQSLSFVLTYSDLSAPVTQSHIHFGKKHMAGGVMVFFCSNLATAPSGTQPCPSSGGTVTGTLSAANVLAIAGQNVPAGDFQALVDALESDTAYANIHTTSFPAGEIRGEVRRGSQEHH